MDPLLWYFYGVFCLYWRLKAPVPIRFHCMEKSSMNILLIIAFPAEKKSIKVYNNIMVRKWILIFIQEMILGS